LRVTQQVDGAVWGSEVQLARLSFTPSTWRQILKEKWPTLDDLNPLSLRYWANTLSGIHENYAALNRIRQKRTSHEKTNIHFYLYACPVRAPGL